MAILFVNNCHLAYHNRSTLDIITLVCSTDDFSLLRELVLLLNVLSLEVMRQVRHFIQDWPLRNHIGQRYGSSKRISAAHHQYQQRADDSQCGPPPPKAQQQASSRQHADQKVARPCSCPRSGRPYSFIGLWRVSRRPRQNSHTHDGIWPPDKREPSCSPCPADSVTPTRTLGVSFLKGPVMNRTLSLSLYAPLQLIDELQLGSAGESCLVLSSARVFVCERVHLFCVVAVFESANGYSIDAPKKDPQGGTTHKYIQM